MNLFLTAVADAAYQPLGLNDVDTCRDQERFDTHVYETRNCRRRVVRMQRRKNKVTRQGGLDRDLRGLEVADLTDEDDVRILTQERAKSSGKVQADLLLHLDLIDPFEIELDRIFGRHD